MIEIQCLIIIGGYVCQFNKNEITLPTKRLVWVYFNPYTNVYNMYIGCALFRMLPVCITGVFLPNCFHIRIGHIPPISLLYKTLHIQLVTYEYDSEEDFSIEGKGRRRAEKGKGKGRIYPAYSGLSRWGQWDWRW